MKSFPVTAASRFLHAAFEPADRLAVVLIQRPSNRVIQHIRTAAAIAASPFQQWLKKMNSERADVYLSLNTLHPTAAHRTKRDIQTIRHIFLDFDDDAPARLRALLSRTDLPQPATLINSSLDHWQVMWPVTRFDPEQAEALQRGLSRQTGADIAATDCARVFRLPEFLNHKRSPPWRVSAQHRSVQSYTPEDFPQSAFVQQHEPFLGCSKVTTSLPRNTREISQSERDWAYAMRSLALGRSQEEVIAAIANNRTDKYNPRYYARLTVTKAARALERDPRSQQYRNAVDHRP